MKPYQVAKDGVSLFKLVSLLVVLFAIAIGILLHLRGMKEEDYVNAEIRWNSEVGSDPEKIINETSIVLRKENPFNFIPYYYRARARIILQGGRINKGDVEDWKMAEKLALDMVKERPALANWVLAECYLHWQEDVSKAKRHASFSIQGNNSLSRAYITRAATEILELELGTGKADLSLAISLCPGCYHAHYLLGVIHYILGEYDSCLNEQLTVLSYSPKYYLAHYVLGVTYRAKDNLHHALQNFDMAISLNPNHYPSCLSRAKIYKELDNLIASNVESLRCETLKSRMVDQ
eukprot:TRINITY_DN495_c0_g1_i1.p1 TRINITY_DN495_c0_g1~~TRINITY_DN495_c0_g1_i1.p1  ORF type:complete len:292 (-),score=27.13 TRINITY_DN495_c0_g1_i1:17-892(-)